jgi:hypothetical protein
VNYLLPFVPFAVMMGVLYAFISRKRTAAEGAAFVLAIVAAFPLLDGGLLLAREYGRAYQGRVAPGVIVEKLSTTGEAGSRTIGRSRRWRRSRRFPTVVTSDGFLFHDVLARAILTGSTDAWVVDYRYPCDSAGACHQREFVSRAFWSELQVGRTVNVRSAKDQADRGRLDENPMWSTALAKLGIGGTLGVVAGLVSGRLTRRRRTYITVPAVVTAVHPVQAGGKVHWRVEFAYFAADGRACEGADEVYVPGVKAGDSCTAVYPSEQPDLGTLRLTGPAPAQPADASRVAYNQGIEPLS